MTDRPTFEQIYMDLAINLAKRSTCRRSKVGCVITSWDHQRVLAVGYNGNYRYGPNDCDDPDAVGSCGCLHAEDNAITKLNFNEPTKKILYTTLSPCKICAKRIINAGIEKIIFLNAYRLTDGIDLLRQRGIEVFQLLANKEA